MTAYVISLNDEEKQEKETKSCYPRKTFFFILVTLLIFIATFRLWLVTHAVAAPAPLMD